MEPQRIIVRIKRNNICILYIEINREIINT